MEHLTIVCSSAILYNTVLQEIASWNRKCSPHLIVKLDYLSPAEWSILRKTNLLQGTVVLLEGLPWKLKLFCRIQEYKDLGYGIKMCRTKDFAVITVKACKLFGITKQTRLCQYLSCSTRNTVKESGVPMPVLYRYMAVGGFLFALKNVPIMAVVEILLLAWLLWQDHKVNQQQYLYGTIVFLEQYLDLLSNKS